MDMKTQIDLLPIIGIGAGILAYAITPLQDSFAAAAVGVGTGVGAIVAGSIASIAMAALIIPIGLINPKLGPALILSAIVGTLASTGVGAYHSYGFSHDLVTDYLDKREKPVIEQVEPSQTKVSKTLYFKPIVRRI